MTKKAFFFFLVICCGLASLQAQFRGITVGGYAHGAALALGETGASFFSVGFSGELGPLKLDLAPHIVVNSATDTFYSPGTVKVSIDTESLQFAFGRYSESNLPGRFLATGSRTRQNAKLGNAFGIPGLSDAGEWRASLAGFFREWSIEVSLSALTGAGTYTDSPPFGSMFFPNSILVKELIDPFDNVLPRSEVIWSDPFLDSDAGRPAITLNLLTPSFTHGTGNDIADSRFSLWAYSGEALDGPVISRIIVPFSSFHQYLAPVYSGILESGIVYSLDGNSHAFDAGAVYTQGLPVAIGTVRDVPWGDWQKWEKINRLEFYASAEFDLWRLKLGGEWKHSVFFGMSETAQFPWMAEAVDCWLSGYLGPRIPVPEFSVLRSLRDGSTVSRFGITFPEADKRSLTASALYIYGSGLSELGQYGPYRWGFSLSARW